MACENADSHVSDAHGDAAASAAAALAALSDDPGKRSVAAHLFTVRTTQRTIQQVLNVVKHRLPQVDEGSKTALAAEIAPAGLFAASATPLCAMSLRRCSMASSARA